MAIEKDMITHYDNIVPMLKRLFYYGSDSLTDMGEKGIAQHSKCSEDIKIIRYVFGDLLEENTNADGKKVYRLRNNYFEDTQRFLMKFFALKKIAIDKLFVSMFVIQTLNVRKGIALTNKELTSTVVFVVADQFLLFGINRYYWITLLHELFCMIVDKAKLCISVRTGITGFNVFLVLLKTKSHAFQ